jgi:hypothetical protein
MHGRGRAAKGVQHEHVEPLGLVCLQLPFEHEPAIAEQHLDCGFAVLEESETPVGQIEHDRIELVIADRVAGAPECCNHAGTEPDNADTQRRLPRALPAPGVMRQGKAQRASFVEAASELHPTTGSLELRALVDARLLQDEAVFPWTLAVVA